VSDFLDDRLAALGSTPVPPLAPADLIRRRGEQRRTRGRLVAGAAGLALVVAASATAYGVTTDRDHGALEYAPQPSGGASPAPSVAHTTGPTPAAAIADAGPPADGDVVLAVGEGLQTRPDGVVATTSLSLYRLRAGSVSAEPVRTLAAPRAGASLYDVSVSAGPTPTTCAIWHVDQENPQGGMELRCYRWGDSEGAAIKAAADDTFHLALSADGRSLAWTNNDTNQMLRIARLEASQVTDVREYLGDPGQPAGDGAYGPGGPGPGADGLAWAGPSALAITVVADSDEGLGLVRFVPASTARGWANDQADVVPLSSADRRRGYHAYDGVRSATSTTAWAIERRNYVYSPILVAQRAVEIELPSGRVKQVVSEPAEGRDVVEVSGGPRAVVYVTDSSSVPSDRRVYVRYPGESRGTEITGLPENQLVLAGS
jgi:hypothetical protein